MKRIALSCLVVALSAGALRADGVDDAIAKALRQGAAEALVTLQKVESEGRGRADYTAELSMAWSDRSDLDLASKNKKSAKGAAEEAVRLAQEALKLDPKLARAHLALAVAYGKQTEFVDNSTKMALSRTIRDKALATIRLDKKEDLAYEILGRWEYGFATLNPLLKVAARVAYGALPEASLENAAKYLEQAVALAPKRISPRHQLALTYKALGEKEKARQSWEKVLALPAEDADDRAAQKEARAAIGR